MARSRLPKNKWIGVRVDDGLLGDLDVYTEAADMDRGDLIRKGLREYMLNHPVKQEPGPKQLTKPGG